MGYSTDVERRSSIGTDISAGLVVFLVALPLCLGIASASGVPPIYGLVAGAIGGIVTGAISRSPISVSGPAAGLVAIILTALAQLNNNLAALQLAIVIAGAIQILLGILKLGSIASFIPNSVIKGMLAGIGVVIILKQIPHALGWDKDFEGNFGYLQQFGSTFVDIGKAVATANLTAIIIFLAGASIILIWDSKRMKSLAFTKFIPGALIAVVVGVGINEWFTASQFSSMALTAADNHLVQIPSSNELMRSFVLPDWSAINNKSVWVTAFTIAIVASIETLLSIDAADKLDSQRRVTPPNRELVAQGIGNALCGVLGGLPVTSVVVRSSANAYAGSQSKVSTIVHGFLLVVAAGLAASLLNKIPLAILASVLILVGYKLTKPSLIKSVYDSGADQFVPFIATLLGVVFLDLLKGVALGFVLGIFFIIRANHHRSFTLVNEGADYMLRFNKDITFTSKATLISMLASVPDESNLIISGIKSDFIDSDILDILHDFVESGKYRGITTTLVNIEGKNWTTRMNS
jgi:MFS superfamily sulfate permease-like transporter